MNQYLSWCHEKLRDVKRSKPRFAGQDVARYDQTIPGNVLLTQRPGRRVPLEPFSEKWGFIPALIASGGVYRGIAGELGFDFIGAEDTPSFGEDLAERIRIAMAEILTTSFMFTPRCRTPYPTMVTRLPRPRP